MSVRHVGVATLGQQHIACVQEAREKRLGEESICSINRQEIGTGGPSPLTPMLLLYHVRGRAAAAYACGVDQHEHLTDIGLEPFRPLARRLAQAASRDELGRAGGY